MSKHPDGLANLEEDPIHRAPGWSQGVNGNRFVKFTDGQDSRLIGVLAVRPPAGLKLSTYADTPFSV